MLNNDNAARVIGGIGLLSFIGAFAVSLGLIKRKNPHVFVNQSSNASESPARLATKALGWGTLYAAAGVSVFVMSVKYLCGFHSVSS